MLHIAMRHEQQQQTTGRLKMRDMNLRHQFARVEIAGHENAGQIRRGRTRLLMKLLTTICADIIQECRVMFGVKSVSRPIFKRRRNVLLVVVFNMSYIRRIKLNNEYIISATQLTAQLTAQLV